MHEIKISDTNTIVLEIKEWEGKTVLNIFKHIISDKYVGIAKGSGMVFSLEEAEELNNIIQSINADNYMLQKYGEIQKGRKNFHIFIEAFKGSNIFQIREFVDSPTYQGYSTKGISFSASKLKEFQKGLNNCIIEFKSILNGDKAPINTTKDGNDKKPEKKIAIKQIDKNNPEDIESFF